MQIIQLKQLLLNKLYHVSKLENDTATHTNFRLWYC
nr:MAG TPA: Dynein heavy chain region D6 P-loop domain [Caudoviricetes sp.]